MKTLLISIILLIFKFSFADVNQVLQQYSKSKAIQADIIKTDFKKTLGLTKITNGNLKYTGGKINILFTGDKKTEIIYNGVKLWIIEYPDLDFDPKGKRKVTEVSGTKPILGQQLVELFQKPKQFLKKFKFLSEKNNIVIFESKPIDKGAQNFKIEIDTKNKIIQSIQFTDDVQTETRIEFVKTLFLKKVPQEIFEYKRKKDDEAVQ